MKKQLIILTAAIALSGCASKPPEWIVGSDYGCNQIGCGKDLEFYPMGPFEAQRNAQARGIEWGKTSSAYPPGSPEHERLLREERARGQTPWHWNQNP